MTFGSVHDAWLYARGSRVILDPPVVNLSAGGGGTERTAVFRLRNLSDRPVRVLGARRSTMRPILQFLGFSSSTFATMLVAGALLSGEARADGETTSASCANCCWCDPFETDNVCLRYNPARCGSFRCDPGCECYFNDNVLEYLCRRPLA